jgi:hypothetical protein
MRTFGQAILVLILLVGLFLIVVSIVLFIWASEPDSFNFNGLFTAAGVICLLLGLGLTVASAVFLRGTHPAERDSSTQLPPSASP